MNDHVATLSPVLLFSGKGGVGKTTLAAATATHLAAAGSRVLLVSTDPAHSLSDVLGVQLSSVPQTVAEGIDAMEVDAQSMFANTLSRAKSGGPLDKLLQMAAQAPGIDEFGAVEVLLAAIESADHDAVIFDTAPTGHTLRLLALPELLDGWFGTLLQLRSQIARATRFFKRLWPQGGVGPNMDELEQGLDQGRDRVAVLRAMLKDPQKAQIFLVTIPEAMSVAETMRTLDLLQHSGLPVGAILVNQMQPEVATCSHCSRRHEIHSEQLAELKRRANHVPLRVLQSEPKEIHGLKRLAELAGKLWS